MATEDPLKDPEFPRVEGELANAIKTASNKRIRTLLLSLCESHEFIHQAASTYLLVEEPIAEEKVMSACVPKIQSIENSEEQKGTKRPRSDSDAVQSPSKKVKKRFQFCSQCCTEFEVTKNHDDACYWHPGA
jgi:hypothetical protein